MVVFYETVGVRHRLRVVWRGESVGKWKGVFSTVCRYVGWVRSNLVWYVFVFSRLIFA